MKHDPIPSRLEIWRSITRTTRDKEDMFNIVLIISLIIVIAAICTYGLIFNICGWSNEPAAATKEASVAPFYLIIAAFFIGGTLGFFVGVFCSSVRESEPEKKLPLAYHNYDKNKTP